MTRSWLPGFCVALALVGSGRAASAAEPPRPQVYGSDVALPVNLPPSFRPGYAEARAELEEEPEYWSDEEEELDYWSDEEVAARGRRFDNRWGSDDWAQVQVDRKNGQFVSMSSVSRSGDIVDFWTLVLEADWLDKPGQARLGLHRRRLDCGRQMIGITDAVAFSDPVTPYYRDTTGRPLAPFQADYSRRLYRMICLNETREARWTNNDAAVLAYRRYLARQPAG